jgi:hypothetical protein
VVGLDYTFGPRVYANLQWVHGLFDEFGAGDFISDGVAVRGSRTGEDTDVPLLQCAVLDSTRGERCAIEVLRPRLGDYLVLGVDVKFFNDNLLVRLFSILDLTGVSVERWDADADRRVRTHHSAFSSEGFSAVIFPELTYNFGHGLELSGGALVKLGKAHTKFGDPAAGGSDIWTRARFSW